MDKGTFTDPFGISREASTGIPSDSTLLSNGRRGEDDSSKLTRGTSQVIARAYGSSGVTKLEAAEMARIDALQEEITNKGYGTIFEIGGNELHCIYVANELGNKRGARLSGGKI